MKDITVQDNGDAHAQPSGSSRRSRRNDDSNAPRDAEKECVICQEEKRGQWRALPCAHVFHEHCVQEWLRQNPSCPVCRMSFPTLQAGHAGPGSEAGAWLGSTSVITSDGKLSVLQQVSPQCAPSYAVLCVLNAQTTAAIRLYCLLSLLAT